MDILMFVSQIAASWAAQADLAPHRRRGTRPLHGSRRAAIVDAVQRLFPAAAASDATPRTR